VLHIRDSEKGTHSQATAIKYAKWSKESPYDSLTHKGQKNNKKKKKKKKREWRGETPYKNEYFSLWSQPSFCCKYTNTSCP